MAKLQMLVAGAVLLASASVSFAQQPYAPATGGRCEGTGPHTVCYRGGAMGYETQTPDDILRREPSLKAAMLIGMGLPDDCSLYDGFIPPTRSHALVAKYRECRARR